MLSFAQAFARGSACMTTENPRPVFDVAAYFPELLALPIVAIILFATCPWVYVPAERPRTVVWRSVLYSVFGIMSVLFTLLLVSLLGADPFSLFSDRNCGIMPDGSLDIRGPLLVLGSFILTTIVLVLFALRLINVKYGDVAKPVAAKKK